MKPKLFIFDMDGTLTESKRPLAPSMGKLLAGLLGIARVGVISGADFPQFKRELISRIPKRANFKNLFILPMNGSELWMFRKMWKRAYRHSLSATERKRITKAFNEVMKEVGHKPKKIYGRILDDRGAQITFSGLGNHTPLAIKKKWDPHQKKRKRMRALLKKRLPGFEIGIAGLSSIDVTKKGITKAFGVRRALAHFRAWKKDAVFVGDALFPGGNDYPVKSVGIKTVQVSSPRGAEKLIRSVLSGKI